MSDIRVGLVGHRGDPQLARLVTELEAMGAEPVPFDLTDIPAHVNFHWQGGSLRFGDIELTSLAGIYARTAVFPMPTFVPGAPRDRWEAMTFPVRESGSLMNSVIAELARRMPVVNPPETHGFHHRKPLMYSLLMDSGVPVPEFAVGCDLAAAATFVHGLGEEVVVKPLMGGEVVVGDLSYLRDHHRDLDRRPILLQRRIRGRSLRLYVVGPEVVAAGMVVHGGEVDWRNDLEAIEAITPGEDTASVAVRAARVQGLEFAAVDVEHDGTPWVIDVNPAPMFAGFEAMSGLDVAGPLARHLVGLAAGGSRRET